MALLEVEPGQNIYYEHYRGSGTPVVLVHGWGMTVRCWDLTLPALLESGHEVVAFDHRCCGHSDKDFSNVSVASIASDLVSLSKAAGLRRPIVVAWSFGCAVTAEAAGRLGDAVGGIVLVGPPTPRYTQAEGYPHGGTAEILEQTLTALRDTRPEFLKALAQGVCHADVGANTIEWMWQAFMETSPKADAALRDLGVIDHRELLPTIQAPALICSGVHDAVVDPAIATVCADLLPNARLLQFEDSGHAPFLEERERFNGELLAFVADPAGSVAGQATTSSSG
jgi:pimeloyl-[acyl-carrier protein] methyl ester esterase